MIEQVIIEYILNCFGISNSELQKSFSIFDPKFKLKKQISIELDNNESISKELWASSAKINNSILKILASDISVNSEEREYVVIFQLDELSCYALTMEIAENKICKGYYFYENNTWIPLSKLALAKLLVGIEQLQEVLINFETFDKYQELYQFFINFLNHAEQSNNQ